MKCCFRNKESIQITIVASLIHIKYKLPGLQYKLQWTGKRNQNFFGRCHLALLMSANAEHRPQTEWHINLVEVLQESTNKLSRGTAGNLCKKLIDTAVILKCYLFLNQAEWISKSINNCSLSELNTPHPFSFLCFLITHEGKLNNQITLIWISL